MDVIVIEYSNFEVDEPHSVVFAIFTGTAEENSWATPKETSCFQVGGNDLSMRGPGGID